jgi:hypothetical protein
LKTVDEFAEAGILVFLRGQAANDFSGCFIRFVAIRTSPVRCGHEPGRGRGIFPINADNLAGSCWADPRWHLIQKRPRLNAKALGEGANVGDVHFPLSLKNKTSHS